MLLNNGLCGLYIGVCYTVMRIIRCSVLYTVKCKKKKIAIRGDGKSPDQKVIDMQLQAANLVYIFDVIILSVTANKVEG